MSKMTDRFVADIRKWAPALNTRLNRCYQNIVAECADQGVITPGRWGPGTPVDTGFARRSWRFGIGGPVDGPSMPASKGDQGASSPDLSGITRLDLGQVAYLTTNCEYMPSLEYGHSKQAPEGMVRTVLAQAQSIADFVASSMLRTA